jgi:hypothetical protein
MTKDLYSNRTTIDIQLGTRERIKRHFIHYGSTYDSTLNEILESYERNREWAK